MKELGKDKALIINTIASFVTFIVGLGIAFFFTPYSDRYGRGRGIWFCESWK